MGPVDGLGLLGESGVGSNACPGRDSRVLNEAVSKPCLSLACALVCQSSDRLSIHVEFECFLRFLSVLRMRYPDAALQQCYP